MSILYPTFPQRARSRKYMTYDFQAFTLLNFSPYLVGIIVNMKI